MTMNDDHLTLRLPHAAGFGKHGPRMFEGHPLTLVVRVSKMPKMTILTITILQLTEFDTYFLSLSFD